MKKKMFSERIFLREIDIRGDSINVVIETIVWRDRSGMEKFKKDLSFT